MTKLDQWIPRIALSLAIVATIIVLGDAVADVWQNHLQNERIATVEARLDRKRKELDAIEANLGMSLSQCPPTPSLTP